jgi:hypothetical protein
MQQVSNGALPRHLPPPRATAAMVRARKRLACGAQGGESYADSRAPPCRPLLPAYADVNVSAVTQARCVPQQASSPSQRAHRRPLS